MQQSLNKEEVKGGKYFTFNTPPKYYSSEIPLPKFGFCVALHQMTNIKYF